MVFVFFSLLGVWSCKGSGGSSALARGFGSSAFGLALARLYDAPLGGRIEVQKTGSDGSFVLLSKSNT